MAADPVNRLFHFFEAPNDDFEVHFFQGVIFTPY